MTFTRLIRVALIAAAEYFLPGGCFAQPCTIGYIFTASPQPIGGTYAAGQTVTFCYTLTNWNTTNANWFHGLVPTFGVGWDLSTLTPGPAPPPCGGGTGTWGWYPFCDGTGANAVPPIGPGFFFDLDNNGNPGDNFGDLCIGPWTFCFTISVNSGVDFVQGADLNVTVDTFGDSETGSWGSTGCTGDATTSIVATAGCVSPEAGDDAVIALCSTDAPIDLFSQLGGAPTAGGTWTAPDGSPTSASIDPLSSTDGPYTYSLPANGTCPGDDAVVAVTISTAALAGTSTSLALCSSSPPTDLYALLVGADPGGSWTAPDGASTTSTYDPAISQPGSYTYTILSNAPCPLASATVTVAENDAPEAGTDASVSFCSTEPASDLFALLVGAQVGGTWTAPDGSATTSTVTPAIAPSGNYTYTIAGVAPCPSDQASVQVSIQTAVSAGADAQISICDAGPPADLFALLGAADVGGIWTGPGGSAFTGSYDPAVHASGSYIYSIAASSPCPDAQATVVVVENSSPNAGLDANITLCVTDDVIDLFTLLAGADVGGNWTLPDGSPGSGVLTPGSDASGAYLYSIPATAPCLADQSVVDVLIHPAVDAGDDNSINLCALSPSVDLFTLLGTANATGTWTTSDGSSFGGIYDPASADPDVFTYTVEASAPCLAAQASITVNESAAPDAGSDASLALCTTSGTTDLFLLLGGAQSGGTWTSPDGAASTGSIDPATALVGTYTYALDPTPPCPGDAAVVNVTINAPPPGGSNLTATLCETGPVFAIADAFSGLIPLGGTWTDPEAAPHDGQFEPDTDPPGTYTYTLTAITPCPDATSTVTITVDAAPFAGGDGALTLCSSGNTGDLFAMLEGTPDAGGAWTDPLNASTTAVVDPGVAVVGTYTYSLPPNGECAGDEATVQLNVIPAADAGSGLALTVCSEDAAFELYPLLNGNPDVNGTWTDPIGNGVSGNFDPGSGLPGNYTYTVAGAAPCPDADAVLQIAVDVGPYAGADSTLSICPGSDATLLLEYLPGADAFGAWTDPNGIASTGQFDPATSVSGAHLYQVAGIGACAGEVDQSTVIVQLLAPVDASFTIDSAQGCAPLEVRFAANDPDITNVLWDFGDGAGAFTGPVALHTYDPAGQFIASALMTNAQGCTATWNATVPIIAFAPPSPLFSVNPTIASTTQPTVTFAPAEMEGALYTWNVEGLASTTGLPFVYSFPSATGGEYNVCLRIEDELGCAAEACRTVIVRDALTIHAPNAFTPDDDGVNEVFLPLLQGADPEDYTMAIFDRSGALVFQSTTIGEAWTGGMENAEAVLPTGVYIWRIVVRERYTSERRELIGHVTLIR